MSEEPQTIVVTVRISDMAVMKSPIVVKPHAGAYPEMQDTVAQLLANVMRVKMSNPAPKMAEVIEAIEMERTWNYLGRWYDNEQKGHVFIFGFQGTSP